MESLIMVLFVFLVCICIGSVSNILLKTTKKRDWLINKFRFINNNYASIKFILKTSFW
jgi:ABC-type phosphate transport system permease subunit